MAIQKSEGCNKMTCGACGAFFCWRCNRAVEGYDHFRAGACVLFDHGDIQRWEVELQVQIERQAPACPAILSGAQKFSTLQPLQLARCRRADCLHIDS